MSGPDTEPTPPPTTQDRRAERAGRQRRSGSAKTAGQAREGTEAGRDHADRSDTDERQADTRRRTPRPERRTTPRPPGSTTRTCGPRSAAWATCWARRWCASTARSCSTQVEAIRARGKEGADVFELLADTDPATAIRLVRAFTAYFNLANTAEQVHRGRELAATRAAEGSWIGQAVDKIEAAGLAAAAAEAVRYLSVRPVFTAHPTEAAPAHGAGQAPQDRRAARRAGDAAHASAGWPRPSSSSGRPTSCASPGPSRSTRPATPSTTWTSWPRTPRRRSWRSWPSSCAAWASSCRWTARPLAFGSWIGGDRDGNPNVTPADDPGRAGAPARARHPHHAGRDGPAAGAAVHLRADRAAEPRSCAPRSTADLAALPEIPARYRRLNAEEPYRLKATAIRQKLLEHPAPASPTAGRTTRGRDYRGTGELLRDLTLIRDSLLADRGQLIADRRAGDGDPHGRRVRAPARHAGRARALRRPPPRAGPAVRPARRPAVALRRPAARLPDPAAGQGAGLHPAAVAAGPGAGRDAAGRGRGQDLRRLHRDPRGVPALRPGRHRVLHRVDDPRRGRPVRRRGPGARGGPGRRPGAAPPRSASSRCWRRPTSSRSPGASWTSCCPTPPTGPWSRRAAACRRSCSATATPTRWAASPPRSGRSSARSASCATPRCGTASGCGCSTAAAAPWAAAAARRTRRSWPSPGARWTARSR